MVQVDCVCVVTRLRPHLNLPEHRSGFAASPGFRMMAADGARGAGGQRSRPAAAAPDHVDEIRRTTMSRTKSVVTQRVPRLAVGTAGGLA